jgi:hypothetical protein
VMGGQQDRAVWRNEVEMTILVEVLQFTTVTVLSLYTQLSFF